MVAWPGLARPIGSLAAGQLAPQALEATLRLPNQATQGGGFQELPQDGVPAKLHQVGLRQETRDLSLLVPCPAPGCLGGRPPSRRLCTCGALPTPADLLPAFLKKMMLMTMKWTMTTVTVAAVLAVVVVAEVQNTSFVALTIITTRKITVLIFLRKFSRKPRLFWGSEMQRRFARSAVG